MWSAQEHAHCVFWAEQIRQLLLIYYPDAPKIRLVMDNLNTHAIASLYQTFPAEKARQLAKRLEIHYTPKHGSWLDMAEIEIGILSRQCLSRRISELSPLKTEISAWESDHNILHTPIDWQFTQMMPALYSSIFILMFNCGKLLVGLGHLLRNSEVPSVHPHYNSYL